MIGWKRPAVQQHADAVDLATGLASEVGLYTFAFRITDWKKPFLKRYFPDRCFYFVSSDSSEADLAAALANYAVNRSEFLVWGGELPEAAKAIAKRHDISVTFIEDGFLRSARPSASRSHPLSLTLDSKAPYFSCREASDLEILFKEYDFEGDEALLARAREGIKLLCRSGVSKYNGRKQMSAEDVYGEKTRKRVLVIGQVEDDASIREGCLSPITNHDLVRLAAVEQNGAQILYRPHPDVLSRVRVAKSDPAEVAHLCELVTESLPISEALRTVDHVYTITSLVGFEALLRGVQVTVAGCPFYSGWGLTDDRQPSPRRGRNLSIEALFAGAYLLYPRYFDPETGEQTSFEATVEGIKQQLSCSSRRSASGSRWRAWGPYGMLGWRHMLTPFVASLVRKFGSDRDFEDFRADPIGFFRSLSDPRLRAVGRVLYPFG
ncbi:Capsule polysaccharide biosynthesis protein [Ensifer sp. OV372]|nr:Capsule polysaccharide biosynthesis protein [Ensifer sp. OV372]